MTYKENTFQERFKKALKNSDLTQSDLSKLTGINKAFISYYYNGKFEPKQDKLYLISKALNVKPSWLLGYDEHYEDSFLNLYFQLNKENKEKINELILFYLNNQTKTEEISNEQYKN